MNLIVDVLWLHNLFSVARNLEPFMQTRHNRWHSCNCKSFERLEKSQNLALGISAHTKQLTAKETIHSLLYFPLNDSKLMYLRVGIITHEVVNHFRYYLQNEETPAFQKSQFSIHFYLFSYRLIKLCFRILLSNEHFA